MGLLKNAGETLRNYASVTTGNIRDFMNRRKLAGKIEAPINLPGWEDDLKKAESKVMNRDYKGAEQFVRQRLQERINKGARQDRFLGNRMPKYK